MLTFFCQGLIVPFRWRSLVHFGGSRSRRIGIGGPWQMSQSRQIKQSFSAQKAVEVDTIQAADVPENRYDYTLPFFSTFIFSAKLRDPFWVRKEKKERKDASNVFQIFFNEFFFTFAKNNDLLFLISQQKTNCKSAFQNRFTKLDHFVNNKTIFPNNPVYN